MAAIGFDTLKTARRLKDAGVPEAQAEVQAEVMAEAFVFNMDALVTKDYLDQCLDARFAKHEAQFEARLMAKIDKRFARIDERLNKIDGRFDKIDGRFAENDGRFDKIDGSFDKIDGSFDKIDGSFDKIDGRFAENGGRFDRIETHLHHHDLQFVEVRGELKLHRWMLALILATTVLPYLQKLFVLLGG